jgi:hypothetical protein
MSNTHVYHIYAKNNCIYHSLTEEEFIQTWKMINNFLSLVDCQDITLDDISYEKLLVNSDLFPNSPPLTTTI